MLSVAKNNTICLSLFDLLIAIHNICDLDSVVSELNGRS